MSSVMVEQKKVSESSSPKGGRKKQPSEKQKTWQYFFQSHSAQLLAAVTLLGLWIILAIMSPYFFTLGNFNALLQDASVYILLALGLTFVIATGGIDLTAGFGLAFTGVVLAMVMRAMVDNGLPTWSAVLAGIVTGILAGALLGAANGFLISYLKLQPMIATLAMMLVVWGLALVLSRASAIPLSDVPGFLAIGLGQTFGITNSLFLVLLVSVVAYFLLNRTLIGRYAIAMGSNEDATSLSGVNVKKWKYRVYVLGGTFTGIAGVLMASRLASGKPDVGQSYEMYAIAAAVIGGASLRGGKASVVGSVIGAILIATIRDGAVLLGVADQWQKVILGAVIIVAVYLDVRRQRQA